MAPKSRRVNSKSKRKGAEESDKKLAVSLWRLKLQRQLKADGEIVPENKAPGSSNMRDSDVACRTEDLAAKIRDSFSCLSNPRRFAERIKEKFYVLSSRSLNQAHTTHEVDWKSCSNQDVSTTSSSKKKKMLNMNTSMRLIIGMQQAEKEYMLRTLWETHPKMDFLVLQNILASCNWDLKKAQQVLDEKLNAGNCATNYESKNPSVTRRKRKRDNPVKKVSTIPNASSMSVDVQSLQLQIKPELLRMQLRRALQQSSAKEGDSDCEIVEVVDKKRNSAKRTRSSPESLVRKNLKSKSGSILRSKLLQNDA